MISRREFIKKSGKGGGALILFPSLAFAGGLTEVFNIHSKSNYKSKVSEYARFLYRTKDYLKTDSNHPLGLINVSIGGCLGVHLTCEGKYNNKKYRFMVSYSDVNESTEKINQDHIGVWHSSEGIFDISFKKDSKIKQELDDIMKHAWDKLDFEFIEEYRGRKIGIYELNMSKGELLLRTGNIIYSLDNYFHSNDYKRLLEKNGIKI